MFFGKRRFPKVYPKFWCISEDSAGLSLSLYRSKALSELNMNIKDTFFDDIFLWMNHKRMKNTDFCSKELAICNISLSIILKRENSKHGKFFEIIPFLKSYFCLTISLRFIRCFLSKTSERFLSSTFNSLFKHFYKEMVIHSQSSKIRTSFVKLFENAGTLRPKCIFFHPLGI